MRKAFACDKRVINIDETNIGEIQIVDHSVKLNLTRLVESERMPYLEKRSKELKERIITNENTIEALAGTTQEKIKKK